MINISRANTSPAHNLTVSFAITYRPILELLQAKYGGSISRRIRHKGHKPIYQYRITNGSAQPFLEDVYPHMHEKKAQAWLALEFLAQRNKDKHVRITPEEIALRDGFRLALQLAKQVTY